MRKILIIAIVIFNGFSSFTQPVLKFGKIKVSAFFGDNLEERSNIYSANLFAQLNANKWQVKKADFEIDHYNKFFTFDTLIKSTSTYKTGLAGSFMSNREIIETITEHSLLGYENTVTTFTIFHNNLNVCEVKSYKRLLFQKK